MPDGRSRCFCGAKIDIAGTEQHVYAAHMVERESNGGAKGANESLR